jgi:antitoxin component YwqK of YwqJK toxin-antitoxin module
VKRYKNNVLDGQSQWYYRNGNIEEVVMFKQGKANGNAYYFYEDGYLKSFRYWSDDKMIGWANDFYDNDNSWQIKSILFFNDYGQLIYQRNYDTLNHIINEEGHF